MLPAHQISRRSVRGRADLPAISTDLFATPADLAVTSAHTPRSFTKRQVVVAHADLHTAVSDPVTSGDLTSAGSQLQEAYQPHYTDYGRQQGRQNYAVQRDPYERYLPREDDSDPYFRYAPRESIQHFHDDEDDASGGEEGHIRHDFYGRPQRTSYKKRPQVDYDDYENAGYHGDDRQDEDYPADYTYDDEYYPSNGRPADGSRGNRRPDDGYRGNSRPDNGRVGDDFYEKDNETENDQDEYYSGALNGRRKRRRRYPKRHGLRYGNEAYEGGDRTRGTDRDKQFSRRAGEIQEEASQGYEDTREAVSDMLDAMSHKRNDDNCKEVKRDGMTCFQCTDSEGMETEDCAYAGGDPDGRHTSYSVSSSYGETPRKSRPSRDPSATYTPDRSDVYRQVRRGRKSRSAEVRGGGPGGGNGADSAEASGGPRLREMMRGGSTSAHRWRHLLDANGGSDRSGADPDLDVVTTRAASHSSFDGRQQVALPSLGR
ncbi:uncharacterized protein LOC119092670 [Pollicipes pollicipes]|uniref:uncharacterized protein LOC119092670 n=1 Tax=Pollicipes pollicipes TaxID=41117 RepID=UPI0018852503|nr:uncharacterized protein LOC119092670 [Pollicipes pollicipes]